ncbi:hypothetical protein NYZ99_20085 [Maribacter litopenaei]|uniref:SprB repeat-containing protein n=1 Tax=Maribacter litopenaei TaxID=2976127 RepID=A0ABY5Y7I1_9FLAO|nr:hypothetical protein [Maribacter litopenaei]UWX54985.1 hypothetical protein NYZ99_20085 [Maribacter litopenaei]
MAPDTYTVRVTDVDGCFYEENYTIMPIVPITMSGSTIVPVTCFGATDGTVQFNVNYQVGQNFTYTVTDSFRHRGNGWGTGKHKPTKLRCW